MVNVNTDVLLLIGGVCCLSPYYWSMSIRSQNVCTSFSLFEAELSCTLFCLIRWNMMSLSYQLSEVWCLIPKFYNVFTFCYRLEKYIIVRIQSSLFYIIGWEHNSWNECAYLLTWFLKYKNKMIFFISSLMTFHLVLLIIKLCLWMLKDTEILIVLKKY